MTRRYKALPSHVWCDACGTIHPREKDWYQDGSQYCRPDHWRSIHMLLGPDEDVDSF